MEEAGEFVMELCPADHCTYLEILRVAQSPTCQLAPLWPSPRSASFLALQVPRVFDELA